MFVRGRTEFACAVVGNPQRSIFYLSLSLSRWLKFSKCSRARAVENIAGNLVSDALSAVHWCMRVSYAPARVDKHNPISLNNTRCTQCYYVALGIYCVLLLFDAQHTRTHSINVCTCRLTTTTTTSTGLSAPVSFTSRRSRVDAFCVLCYVCVWAWAACAHHIRDHTFARALALSAE